MKVIFKFLNILINNYETKKKYEKKKGKQKL